MPEEVDRVVVMEPGVSTRGQVDLGVKLFELGTGVISAAAFPGGSAEDSGVAATPGRFDVATGPARFGVANTSGCGSEFSRLWHHLCIHSRRLWCSD